jgi:hypothetical protein
MSSVVWWYIWICVKVYLELGLFIASLITIITLINNTIDRTWLRDFFFTLFLHPVVIYYLIKELENGE